MTDSGSGIPGPADLSAYLREQIALLPPGASLPSVRTLQTRFRVSPVTVTKALSKLRAEGLIIVRPGHGAFTVQTQPRRAPEDASWQSLILGAREPNFLESHMAPLPEGEILLNSGYLSPDLQPIDALRRHAALAAAAPSAWAQLPSEGLPELREWFAEDIKCGYAPHDVIILSGGQAALSTVFRSITRPGAAILVESPTYVGALAAARAAGLVLIPVPLDPQGVRPEDLAAAFAEHRAAIFYCQPLHANPSGITLATERRAAVVRAAEAAGAFIVEDDSTRHLHFGETEPAPPLASLDPARVILIRSLTKPTSPSLRIAAVCSKGPVRERIRALRVTDEMFIGGLLQEVARSFVTSADWPAHLKRLRKGLRERLAVALRAIARELGDAVSPVPPSGGLHLWLPLGDGADERAIVAALGRRHVHVSPGRIWHPAEPPGAFLRLSFGGATGPEIEAGVKAIGEVRRGG